MTVDVPVAIVCLLLAIITGGFGIRRERSSVRFRTRQVHTEYTVGLGTRPWHNVDGKDICQRFPTGTGLVSVIMTPSPSVVLGKELNLPLSTSGNIL